MFRAPNHRYDRAVPGSYRLIPTAEMRTKLTADYGQMSAMIFGTPPAFADVIASIEALERYLNMAPTKASQGSVADPLPKPGKKPADMT